MNRIKFGKCKKDKNRNLPYKRKKRNMEDETEEKRTVEVLN